jgi:hypothetical protein
LHGHFLFLDLLAYHPVFFEDAANSASAYG